MVPFGGEEDGVVGMGECADPDECKAIADLGVDMLAAGIGNTMASIRLTGLDSALRHWQLYRRRQVRCLSFFMADTGIPDDMIKKAINLGVAKINVNTECQLSFAAATRKYIEEGKDLQGKGLRSS